MDSESTDTTARCSVAHVSWIAHASCCRLLVLAGRVEVANIHFQAGYLCMKKKKSYRCIIINVPSHCSHDLDFFLKKMELLKKILESVTMIQQVAMIAGCPDNKTNKFNLVVKFYECTLMFNE